MEGKVDKPEDTALSLEWRKLEEAAIQADWDRRQAEQDRIEAIERQTWERNQARPERAEAAAKHEAQLAWARLLVGPLMVSLAGVAGYFAIDRHSQRMETEKVELLRVKQEHDLSLQREAADLAVRKFEAQSKAAREASSLSFVERFIDRSDDQQRLALIDYLIAVPVNENMREWAKAQKKGMAARLKVHQEQVLRLEKAVTASEKAKTKAQRIAKQAKAAVGREKSRLKTALRVAREEAKVAIREAKREARAAAANDPVVREAILLGESLHDVRSRTGHAQPIRRAPEPIRPADDKDIPDGW